MSIFYHEDPPNGSKRCSCSRYLASALKEALAKCSHLRGKLSISIAGIKDDESSSDCNFDEEEEVFVSAVIRKYVESKTKRKSISNIAIDSISWALSPEEWNSIMASRRSLMLLQKKEHNYSSNDDDDEEENEIFVSANNSSMLSRSSSSVSNFAEFFSTRTCFSRPSSSRFSNMIGCDFDEWALVQRRSVILEFSNCEGWPFGLCRKALLVPPLPKSPSDSWTWKKNHHNGSRLMMIKIHG